ncbi:MAG: tRNA (N6-isopentenyl adenosine(37)-C2)-methylthiotransferase MiaB [Eubacteriales bacterium]|nr:tRNA (N6-isopentenyl adenosine(37)-C2)-methylthiotransferase MiaB [Eubacteriales bacterium]
MKKELDFLLQDNQRGAMQHIKELLAAQNKKYHIHTYGCQMNTHDSEKLAGLLEEMGYLPADDPKDADLILLNTCCVRDHAEVKVHGNLGALSVHKKSRPGVILGVCGCMMQQEGAAAELVSRFPQVDLVFGTHNVHELPTMLYQVLSGRGKAVEISNDVQGAVIERMPVRRNEAQSAWVTIAYGCNNFCTYCIVPYVRGRERSRTPQAILEEIKALEGQGVKEITLLGQNVNSYGKDIDGMRFAQLLLAIERETSQLMRIRFMTSHPKDLSDELIDVMASSSKVCKQLHLPVQSGSDGILAKMNRRYTRRDYLLLVEKLRHAMPDIGLSTDAIVGFPGETDEDFAQTLELFAQVQFVSAYTFQYSPRRGTPAARMDAPISAAVKKERLARLNTLQKEISAHVHQRMVGKTVTVLADGFNPRSTNMVQGRCDEGYKVTFPGTVQRIGTLTPVTITKARMASLLGEPN